MGQSFSGNSLSRCTCEHHVSENLQKFSLLGNIKEGTKTYVYIIMKFTCMIASGFSKIIIKELTI